MNVRVKNRTRNLTMVNIFAYCLEVEGPYNGEAFTEINRSGSHARKQNISGALILQDVRD